jgi:PEP-CTERM motif
MTSRVSVGEPSLKRAKIMALVASLVLTGPVSILSASVAKSAVVISFEEVSGNVVGLLSGSVDLTGAASDGVGTASATAAFVFPSLGAVDTQAFTDGVSLTLYQLSGPTTFGPGGISTANSSSAPLLDVVGAHTGGRNNGDLILPTAYISGTELTGVITFDGQTFASLQMTPGEYIWSLSNEDTVTLTIGATTPLPAALPLFSGGLGLIGLMARRRKRKQVA